LRRCLRGRYPRITKIGGRRERYYYPGEVKKGPETKYPTKNCEININSTFLSLVIGGSLKGRYLFLDIQ
jgi:hypothetical protein